MKKRMAIIVILIFTLLLAGCGSPKGALYKKSKVKKIVREVVPSERYELIRVEPVKDAEATTEVYTFRSKQRNFEFTADNTRRHVFFDMYGKYVQVNYADEVKALYNDEVISILEDTGLRYEKSRIYADTFNDFKTIAEAVGKANECYSEELNYNTAKWMKDNPVTRVSIEINLPENDSVHKSEKICGFAIDGSLDYQTAYDYLCFMHASNLKEGAYQDETAPKDILELGHVGTLKNIYINSVNLSETAYEDARINGLYNNTQSMYYSGYCYALGDYVICLNAGLLDEKYAPQNMEEILGMLTFDYEVLYKKGEINWEYLDSKWEIMATTGDDGYVDSFKVFRDGKDLEIPYVKCGDWTSPVSGTYVVGIRVSDFADIFNLDYTIDELAGEIYFTEKQE